MVKTKSVILRIRNKTDFEEILHKERPVRGRHMSVWIRIREDKEPPRAGLIVGRAVSRLAVIRNRWKRQLRESVRTMAEKLGFGCDIVLKPHAGQINISSKQIREDLEKLIVIYRQRK